MTTIKPIETIYNGYRFRSRLEARWAVFFDVAGINYQYEPEGFNLSDYGYYLPDFYLPDFRLYVEIKPTDRKTFKYVGDDNEWEQKCRAFRDITRKAILLCYGYPADDIYKYLFAYDSCDSSGGSSEWYCLFVTYRNKTVLVTEPTRCDRSIHCDDLFTSSEMVGTPYEYTGDRDLLWDRARAITDFSNKDITTRAKLAARQARFEHGECGAPNG